MNDENDSNIQHMDSNGNPTDSPSGSTLGEDHVFEGFRQIGTPVTKLIATAVAMLILTPVTKLAGYNGRAFFFLPALLVPIVLPTVPGIIVYREFCDEVIPRCRNVCTETEIVSGSLKSLRFLWERYFLCLLPVIALAVGLVVYSNIMRLFRG
jgi:hypothetical protein